MNDEEVFGSADKSENLGLGAIMAALPFLFFLPYVIKDKKYSPYCIFRANQSLITFIVFAALNTVSAVIGFVLGGIPIIGFIVSVIQKLLGLIVIFYYLQNLIFAILGSGKKVFILGLIDILK